jgi:hypothetical protein
MIRKSVERFSEKIMRKQEARVRFNLIHRTLERLKQNRIRDYERRCVADSKLAREGAAGIWLVP